MSSENNRLLVDRKIILRTTTIVFHSLKNQLFIMKKILIVLTLFVAVQQVVAQSDVVQFIKAGAADANKLFQPYLEPYAFALGEGLNNGWYNSAETHKWLGFDLSVSASAIQIPNSAKTFDLSELQFSRLSVVGTNTIAPTIAGADQEGPSLLVTDDQGHELASFKSPAGINLDIVPVPMVQLTFGALPHTDLSLRYVPKVKFTIDEDKANIGMIGAGLKHNFLKSISALKDLPLDAAVFVGYAKIDAETGVTFTPQDYGSGITSVTFTNTDDQMLKISTSSVKYGLVLSKKMGVLTVFGSVMQTTSKSTVDLLGKFPVVTALTNGDLVITDEDALIDPINLDFENSTIAFDAGLRLKLAFFSIYGSVTKAEYTSFNAGISLGFR